MHSRRLVAIPLAAAALAVGCGGGPGAEKPRVAPAALKAGFFGINGQLLRPMAADGRGALLERHLTAIEDLDLDFVRASMHWSALEPSAPTRSGRAYDLRTTDAWVMALARHGLSWYATLQGNPTPTWALGEAPEDDTCGTRAPPADAYDFAALSAAIARRYGSSGSFWREHPDLPFHPVTSYEIWNEPNFGTFWCPGPDPAAYAELLGVASKAIRRADADAEVVLGGLAAFRSQAVAGQPARMGVDGFLAAIVAADPAIADRVDAVGAHPYAATIEEAFVTLEWFRSTLDENGFRGIPLSVNEVGWHTAGPPNSGSVAEPQRAGLLSALTAVVATSACNVVDFAPHTWITPEANPIDAEDWFGLADPLRGDPYLATRGYAAAVASTRSDEVDHGAGTTPACAA